MIQFLHIFRKDVRHLWPDLAVYVGVLLAFGWATPMVWPGAADAGQTGPSAFLLLLSLLRLLLPILWLIILVRLVQDESLVGDRQFWITRPYTRASLLGAKLLFVAACIALPFAAMQCYLLFHAGLHLFAAMPDLLLNLFYLALLTWLPFMVVASVTSTLPRALMSIIGAFVAFFIFTLIVALHLRAQVLTPPFIENATYTLAALGFIAILAWQYATRRTTAARIALIVCAVVLAVLPKVAPADLFFRQHYSVGANGAPANLAFDPDARYPQASRIGGGPFGQPVILPIRPWASANVQPLFHDVGVSYTLDAPGYHYSSPWERGDMNGHTVSLFIPQRVIDAVVGKPVHLHATYVAEEQQPGTPQTVNTADAFDIPGNGHCFYPTDPSSALPSGVTPFCRYPYRDQLKTVVGRADDPATAEASMLGQTYEMRANDNLPVIDPVAQDAINLRAGVPTGTALSFTTFQPVGNIRVDLDIPSITLDPYIVQNMAPQRRRGLGAGAPAAPPAPPAPPAPTPASPAH